MADRKAFEDAVKDLLPPQEDISVTEYVGETTYWNEIRSLGKLIPTDEEFFADDGISYQASYGNHHYDDLTIGQVRYLARLATEEE